MSVQVLTKAEKALVEFLKTKIFVQRDTDDMAIDSERIYRGFHRTTGTIDEEAQQRLPRVRCICSRAAAYANFSGNRRIDAIVEVQTKVFETTDDQHDLIADEVFSYLQTDGIAGDLSGLVDNFTVLFVVPTEPSTRIENNTWISTWSAQLFCAGLDIA